MYTIEEGTVSPVLSFCFRISIAMLKSYRFMVRREQLLPRWKLRSLSFGLIRLAIVVRV